MSSAAIGFHAFREDFPARPAAQVAAPYVGNALSSGHGLRQPVRETGSARENTLSQSPMGCATRIGGAKVASISQGRVVEPRRRLTVEMCSGAENVKERAIRRIVVSSETRPGATRLEFGFVVHYSQTRMLVEGVREHTRTRDRFGPARG